MKTIHKIIREGRLVKVVIIAVAMIVLTWPGNADAYPKSMKKQMLTGPYEILIQKGMDGDSLLFPVEITEPAVVQQIDKILPVVGSALKVRIERYVPDLAWQQYAETSKDGGNVVRLRALGPDVDQEIWLESSDISNRARTSMIGGIAIKKLRGKSDVEKVMKLAGADAVGVLTVWCDGSKVPLEYVVSKGSEIVMPGAKGKFKVLRYLPHYSIDTRTKEVKNASDNPFNPAIEVSFTDGEKISKQWLYSRFPLHPHMESKIPYRVEFTAFDLGGKEGTYIIITAGQKVKPQMLWFEDGKKVMKELDFKTPYPMAKEDYSFVVEELFAGSTLKQRWANNSNELVNPALIVSVGLQDDYRQVVLTLGKLEHVKFDSGTVVLLYKRKGPPGQAAAMATK